MKVELRPQTSAIEWSASELARMRERLAASIERCWAINRDDEIFMRDWGRSRDEGALTTELMTDFFESAHIQSVESGDLNAVYDVEAAYLAWLPFKELAMEIDHERMA